ncbi:hypothetical protein CD116_03720 [Staphylococcus schweitzeri]|uniref:DUF1146 domain-containing protein n=1 Tax=Staphylococcus schweitzeri TaxID=1654388 RepID=A0A2K4AJU4_9STAP|nr:hypothetical protein [Staphylococcus schweitzeri]MBE2129155.1 hypothetical protein [Staphylococcus schweitzeri]PNZ50375.1 hypothetical protein CD116_03720 [Staphylococcus schweitzeri]CDR28418.1 hypothetical protein ERS140147_01550 [Staphylococcus schweitzeri]CDR51574.1 hypothetical protein ERS140159_01530 [Staphylococcus schweitzeri]CDR54734.1 hypothetical protein ERS140266_02119 [Staphylococcus schweitzeri]
MIIVYILLLLILVIANHRIVNRLLSENRTYFVRLVATITTVISFVLVYALIREIMPYVVRMMDLLYHQ